jgi:hypothetical protein
MNVCSEEATKVLTHLFGALKGFIDLLTKESIKNEDGMTAFGIISGTNSPVKSQRTRFSSTKKSVCISSSIKTDICRRHSKVETKMFEAFEKP